jgi:hypothetical protein
VKPSPGGKPVVIPFSFSPFAFDFFSHPQIHHFLFSFSIAYLFLLTFAFDKKRDLKKEKWETTFHCSSSPFQTFANHLSSRYFDVE